MSNESEKVKIGVSVHVFKDIDFSVYFNHLWCVGHWAQHYELVFLGKRGLDAATARNQLADRAIEQGCTHIFSMDGDHLFPVEALPCLLEHKDEAIVSGLVCKRGNGYDQVGYQKTPEGGFLQIDLPLDGRTYQVAICAFGCTLINLEKLQKLKKPYFRDDCRTTPNGELYNFRSDVNLCDMFTDIGEHCWIDTRVLVGHHGMDNVIFPQGAKQKAGADQLLDSMRRLKDDQKGHYYDGQC
jgi:hypothetical protein